MFPGLQAATSEMKWSNVLQLSEHVRQLVQSTAWAPEYRPEGQSMQYDLPTLGCLVPGGQSKHILLPRTAEYRPSLHDWHRAFLMVSTNVPTGHGSPKMGGRMGKAEQSKHKKPIHSVWPTAACEEPEGQAWHSTVPVVLDAVPEGQSATRHSAMSILVTSSTELPTTTHHKQSAVQSS
jgi:hypothetical protein